MASWCECKKTPGYCSLWDRLNTFVCSVCWWPSWIVYDKSHRLCEECGMSFFSPWHPVCRECNEQLKELIAEIDDPEETADIVGQVSAVWHDWASYRDDAIKRNNFLGYNGRQLSSDTRSKLAV